MSLILSLWLFGSATYYDAGVMEQVIAYRERIGQVQTCPDCIGAVAMLDPGYIGRRVWMQAPGRPIEGPFLVVDCAQQIHRDALIERGWAVDVDYETAQRWGMRGPIGPVFIWTEKP